MRRKEIHERVVIKAPPEKVFAALLNSRQHAAFTGRPAKLSSRPGAAFHCYGGYASGRILEVVPAKLIVMAWRSRHWAPEIYSVVVFKLSRRPGGKTQISFTQTGVPAADCRDATKGWAFYYWEPLKRYLEK